MKNTTCFVGVLRGACLLVGLLYSSFSFSQIQTVGTFANDADAYNGYTLVFPMNSKTIYLIDNCGLELHRWQTQTRTLVAYLQPNGDLIKSSIDTSSIFNVGGQSGAIERYSWDGTLLWKYEKSTNDEVLHHDIEILPNGNILAMTWRQLSLAEKRLSTRDSMLFDLNQDMWEEVIYELAPKGTIGADIVWEWHAMDHVVQDVYQNASNYGTISSHPELLNINYMVQGAGHTGDWLHFNSIDYNPMMDQILISSLTFNEIYILDHSTKQTSGHIGGSGGKGGDILYRWGNPLAYSKGNLSNQKLFGQHDPQWIKNGPHTGKVLIFNNGAGRGYSSVDILELPWNGVGYVLDTSGMFSPENAVYSYTKNTKQELYAPFVSGAEILPNGNFFITEGTKGKITEYNYDNDKIVWEYVNPVSPNSVITQGAEAGNNMCFRSYKYASNYSAFNGRSLIPGLPLEKEPWPSDCNGIDTTTDTTTNRLAEMGFLEVDFFPNPSSGMLSINGSHTIEAITIQDAHGRIVYSNNNLNPESSRSIDISEEPEGLYIIRYNIGAFSKIKRILLLKA